VQFERGTRQKQSRISREMDRSGSFSAGGHRSHPAAI
jgi:hypothetical protein